MPLFDLPLAKLKTYRLPDSQPRDFDAFWKRTLAQTARHPLRPRYEPVRDHAYRLVDVHDVTFAGFDGQEVKGWFIEPAGNTKKLPCVVTYIGYGGGRSLPPDHLQFAAAGLANLVMDTRGQGTSWSPGATHDQATTGPHFPGFMTQGIDSPDTYYYRRVFTDAVRAAEAAAAHPRVDPKRIAVTGGSQGGGIAIAAAALLKNRAKLLMADVPFLCGYRRATQLIDTAPYNEISKYLMVHRSKVEQVFNTLAYFDGVNFAPRITACTLFSVGMMDTICPPSTIYAAYNRIKAKKEMRVYDYNNHEGGGPFQMLERMRFAARYL